MISTMLRRLPQLALALLSSIPIPTTALETGVVPQPLKGVTHRGSACTFDPMMQATSFCVNATVASGEVTWDCADELTTMVHRPSDVGWLALGFGQNMIRTQIVVLWQNDEDNNSMTISHRYARFYSEPSVLADPPRVASAIELSRVSDNSWQKPEDHTTYAFKIPARERLLNGTSLKENLIWAYSPIRPKKEYTSHIARHFEIGHLKMEFEVVAPPPPSTGSKPSSGDDKAKKPSTGHKVGEGSAHEDEDDDEDDHYHSGHEKTVHAHAFLLSFGLLFLLPLGILASRWGRTLSPVWFKVHWILNMALAAPVIVLGWLLGPIATWQHGAGHLDDAHKICGFILLGLYGGQVLFGRYIHERRRAIVESGRVVTNHHPPLNVGHVVFGLLFIAMAFFQVRSGLDKLQAEPEERMFAKWYHKVWAVWGIVLPFLYLSGLTLLPRQFKQERAGGLDTRNRAGGEGSYVALAERDGNGRETEEASSSTRLLFEVGRDDEGDEEEREDLKKGQGGSV
ncbi:hypothetical protein NMY22_g8908 [Coprinellus aureogranulatus]|nr:hypothetical protein NMY22_g8908 [Coprinellus aureogranulatus]